MVDFNRRAAVLVPIQEERPGEPSLVLIQRPADMRSHRGQVAFPGGGHEPDVDAGLVETALREAREEIGLDPADVEVIGTLSEYTTLSSEYLVSAFVGRIPPAYEFTRCEREVDRVFTAPVAMFLEPRRESVSWQYDGRTYTLPCVRVDGYVVWGLTLQIIDDLVAAMPRVAGGH